MPDEGRLGVEYDGVLEEADAGGDLAALVEEGEVVIGEET